MMMMTTSRSEGAADAGADYDLARSLEIAREGCERRFTPASGGTDVPAIASAATCSRNRSRRGPEH